MRKYLTWDQAEQIARDLADGKEVGPETLQQLGAFLAEPFMGLFALHKSVCKELARRPYRETP